MFLSIRPFLCGSLLGNFRLPNCSLLKICSYINLQIPEKIPATQIPHLFKLWWSNKKKTTNVSGEKKHGDVSWTKIQLSLRFPIQTKKKNMATFCNYQKPKNTYQTETAFSAFSHLQPFPPSRLEPTLKGEEIRQTNVVFSFPGV